MGVYNPAEDSYLLAEAVKKLAKGRVLDMGTGSGILAETALKSSKVTAVTAADINKECAKNVSRKIKFVHSDLFSRIPKRKFDTIIFNPPYLPQDRGIEDASIYGGKKGHEIIGRFLDSCSGYLADKGMILLVFSSLTKKEKINEIIENNCLESEEIGRKELPFLEMLYVYGIRKSRLLLKLEKDGIGGVRKFSEGNRGVIYTGNFRGRKVAIKARKADSAARGAIENEAKWLKILNKKGMGPKLAFSGSGYFVYEFVEGKFITDYLSGCSRENAVAVIKSVLRQCRKLDELGVNKEEMLRPYRHVIMRGGKPVMIDFERCGKARKPKNVTQFCQFLASGSASELLSRKGIIIDRDNLLAAARTYKNSQNSGNFMKLEAQLWQGS